MNKALNNYLKVCLFLLPIAYLPVVNDVLGFGKNWLFVSMSVLGLILWLIETLLEKENGKIRTSKAWRWLLFLTIFSAVFWFLAPAGVQARSLVSVPGMGMLLGLTIWSFLWLQLERQDYKGEENFLTAGVLISVIISVAVFLIPTNKLPLVWPKDNPVVSITSDWSILGSLWTELWLLVIVGGIWMKRLWEKQKGGQNYGGEILVTAVVVLGLSLNIFRLTQNKVTFLNANSSWIIATETLKYRPLQGVGVGNFLEAFNRYRPTSFNTSKNWSENFGLWSANLALQIWTELGMVGLLLGVLMTIAFVKGQLGKKSEILALVTAIVLWLSPVNLPVLVVLMWLATRSLRAEAKALSFKVGEKGVNLAPALMILVLAGGGLTVMYFWTKAFIGEVNLRKSLVYATKNEGNKTYEWQIKAIQANPNNAYYRAIYSQTNLALAMGILNQQEISEEQKQQAQVLITQADREAKAAISLDPRQSSYWANLASVYRALIELGEGQAVDWYYQSLNQAIALNPNDPGLRMELGGLSYGTGRYDEAERVFEEAVRLKPDMANAWYNWAHAAKKLDKVGDAVFRLNQAVSLVPIDSGDYDLASKELEKWKKEYEELVKKYNEQVAAQQQEKEPETLKTPEALPTGNQSVLPDNIVEPPEVTVIPTVILGE
jgi:tetratricopeptide (TPR) repeat protein